MARMVLEASLLPDGRLEAEMSGGPCWTALVVEDDPGVGKLVRDVLRIEGFSVTSAESASEAFVHLSSRGHFDLLITDYELQRVTGLALAREAREHHPGTRIVLMTGSLLDSALLADILSVADQFLEKPFGLEELRSVALSVPGWHPTG